MSQKHEGISDSNLLYCFVQLSGAKTQPIIFVVPSADVAQYVKWEHALYRQQPRERPLAAEISMRRFRIEEEDPHGYRDNWRLFE